MSHVTVTVRHHLSCDAPPAPRATETVLMMLSSVSSCATLVTSTLPCTGSKIGTTAPRSTPNCPCVCIGTPSDCDVTSANLTVSLLSAKDEGEKERREKERGREREGVSNQPAAAPERKRQPHRDRRAVAMAGGDRSSGHNATHR